MRAEDVSAIQIANLEQLGEVYFFRYFLSVGNLTKAQIPTAIFEAYSFLKEINQKKDLERVYASANVSEEVILITGRGENGLIANLFLDFTSKDKEVIKQTEIVGTKGMYQFDSTSETAFQSNFLDQDLEFVFKEASQRELVFFEKIKESYSDNKLVFVGGDGL